MFEVDGCVVRDGEGETDGDSESQLVVTCNVPKDRCEFGGFQAANGHFSRDTQAIGASTDQAREDRWIEPDRDRAALDFQRPRERDEAEERVDGRQGSRVRFQPGSPEVATI